MRLTKDHLPWDSGNLPCTGPNLWVCPECQGVNAWNYEDAVRAQKRMDVQVEVCTGSAFDNICGHCHADIVKPDSPILAECYTHSMEVE